VTEQFSEAYPNAATLAPSGASPEPLPIDLPLQRAAPPDDLAKSETAVTVVVPTRNERGNIATLVHRLQEALPAGQARILFVDDSDDGTQDEVAHVASLSDIHVQVIHRDADEREGALGGAVLRGLRATDSPWVVVMDADLQHPPEVVPALLAEAMDLDADVVVASRHVPGGDERGLSGLTRVLVSRASITVSKLLFPRRLAGISDPMSGFFVVRRDRLDLDRLRPQGFKILLETLARHARLRRSEIPFAFGERLSGDSKASLREGLVFIKQLVRLRLAVYGSRRPGALGRAFGFASVGATGVLVNTFALWLLVDPRLLRIHYLLGAVLATQVSSTWNFKWIDTYVYRGPKRGTRRRRYLGFLTMSNAVLVLRLPVLALLVGALGMQYLAANALTLLLGFLVRFGSQERLTLVENTHV
jgi:dolichol-phosphate mannosyltransferase